MNYELLNNTFIAKPKDDPKDRIEIEVGDSKVPDKFIPQVKLMRWDNEVNFSVRFLADRISGVESYSLSDGIIEYRKGKYKARFYENPTASDGGGYEFEIEIPKKPTTNTITFSINTKELDFFYQPELTVDEVVYENKWRPENVVGSYAVYHKTKSGNIVDGKEYKTGKAFHIYRPRVRDSANNETWAVLNIGEMEGVMTITIDQVWLDNAVYPVIVDPTFGYTTAGAGRVYIDTGPTGSVFTGAAGTGDSISMYVDSFQTTHKSKCAIYQHSDSSLLTNGQTVEYVGSTDPANWRTYNFVTSPTLSAVDYVLQGWSNTVSKQGYRLYYDSGDTNQGHKQSADYTTLSGVFPNPGTFTQDNEKYSIYVTYTAGGGGGETTISGWKTLLGVGQACLVFLLKPVFDILNKI